MGKRIIQQRRGRGTKSYRVRVKAYVYKIQYPANLKGVGKVIKLLNSRAHSAPLAKVECMMNSKKNYFYIPAFKGMIEGQQIQFDTKEIKPGNIVDLENVPVQTPIYCIESRPGDGGKFIKSGGTHAEITKMVGDAVGIIFPSKKEKTFHKKCRAMFI